jgi:hypothetical protein
MSLITIVNINSLFKYELILTRFLKRFKISKMIMDIVVLAVEGVKVVIFREKKIRTYDRHQGHSLRSSFEFLILMSSTQRKSKIRNDHEKKKQIRDRSLIDDTERSIIILSVRTNQPNRTGNIILYTIHTAYCLQYLIEKKNGWNNNRAAAA